MAYCVFGIRAKSYGESLEHQVPLVTSSKNMALRHTALIELNFRSALGFANVLRKVLSRILGDAICTPPLGKRRLLFQMQATDMPLTHSRGGSCSIMIFTLNAMSLVWIFCRTLLHEFFYPVSLR